MLRLLADENIRGQLVRGLLRREPALNIVRVQDVGLRGADDATVLEWAAHEDRLLITHDINTIPGAAYKRVEADLPMPGVLAVPWASPVGRAIEDILLIAQLSSIGEWEGQVIYLPL